MARTSKTKVSGGPRQDTMLRAAAEGSRQRARAQEQLTASRERAAESAQRGIQNAAAHGAQGTRQKRQIKAQQAEAQLDRDQRAKLSHQQMLERQAEGAANRSQRSMLAGQRMEQEGQLARERMNLDAAKSGLQRNPEVEARQAELEAEMERGARQGQMPAELDGQTFIPTDASKARSAEELEIKRIRAETERSRVEVMRQNTLQKARAAASRADEASYQAAKENYSTQIKKLGARADRIIKSSMGDPSAMVGTDDVAYLKRLAGDNPDPELQQEIESGQLGQASARFLKGKMIKDSLDFVAEKGDWPNPDLIDEAHPMYAQFQGHMQQAGEYLRYAQKIGAIVGISSLFEGNRLKRRLAAVTMKLMAQRQAMRAEMGQGGSQPLPSAPGLGAQNVQPGGAPAPDTIGRPDTGVGVQPPGEPQFQ